MRQDYPLYVAWYSLLGDLIDRAEKFPRTARFTLADRMVNAGLDIIELIVESIYTRDREDLLQRANLRMELLRVYVRLACDRKFISLRQYEYLSERIDEAGRMVGGWIKSDA